MASRNAADVISFGVDRRAFARACPSTTSSAGRVTSQGAVERRSAESVARAHAYAVMHRMFDVQIRAACSVNPSWAALFFEFRFAHLAL